MQSIVGLMAGYGQGVGILPHGLPSMKRQGKAVMTFQSNE